MGCKSCKKRDEIIFNENNIKKSNNIKDYILKFLLFLIFAILITPFIIPIVLVVLFRIVVLSKTINLLPVVKAIGEKIFKEKEDEEDEFETDEDYDNESDDDYEPINKHEIIQLK
jgi:hypothetical protein